MSKQAWTFDGWMFEVDRQVYGISGCSVHDLSDCCFREWYDDGISPARAAKMALEHDGF